MPSTRLLVAFAFVFLGAVWAHPTTAEAHPVATTAIVLDVGPRDVRAVLQLPIDQLAVALEDQQLTAATAARPTVLAELRAYVLRHIAAAGPGAATRWDIDADGGRVEQVDGVDHVVFTLNLQRPPARTGAFELTYDGIVQRVLNHEIFVSSRASGADGYTVLGVLDWHQHTITVSAASPATGTAFTAAVHLGSRHIAQGADHLLFLTMLLLPAPLVGGLRRSSVRVVHVVTAFTVGHSLTLALAGLGYVSAPARLVESLIALSILVSAIHAVRPLTPNGERWIAASFGLMHGLAFASLLGHLGLTRGSLVTNLLGFNLGVELVQLTVVALLMPSLLLLSRTPLYGTTRVAGAAFGFVLSAAWLAERTTLVAKDPLNGVSDALIGHPLRVAAALAGFAVLAWICTSAPIMRARAARAGARSTLSDPRHATAQAARQGLRSGPSGSKRGSSTIARHRARR